MAIYSSNNRAFVSPTSAKTELDGSDPGAVYVYEIATGKRATLRRVMNIVPRVGTLTIAFLCYVNFFVEDELKQMMWLYVMLAPAAVYFGALFFTTTFPRRVGVLGMRLSLSAIDDSVAFCWAQIAIFLPMVVAFVIAAQMHWRPSLGIVFATVAFGICPVVGCAFSAYRLRLVLQAGAKSAPFRKL